MIKYAAAALTAAFCLSAVQPAFAVSPVAVGHYIPFESDSP